MWFDSSKPVRECQMAPRLSYGWLVWIIVVAVGEASIGDRHPVYLKCLDRYVLTTDRSIFSTTSNE